MAKENAAFSLKDEFSSYANVGNIVMHSFYEIMLFLFFFQKITNFQNFEILPKSDLSEIYE